MLDIILLILLVASGSLHGVFLGFYNKNYPGDKSTASHVYSAILGVIVAFVSIAVSGFKFSFSWLSLGMGVLNGIMVILYNFFLAKGTARGSYALLMIAALSSGILMPLAANAILGDTFKPLTLIGIAVMLVAFVLLSVDFKEMAEAKGQQKNKKLNIAYIISLIFVFISNGTYGILNSFEARFEASEHKTEFIVFTYLTAALVSLALMMVSSRKFSFMPIKQTKKSSLFLVLGALSITSLINVLMLLLARQKITTEVIYTVNNGGTLVLSAFLALFIFKDKISVQKWIGIGVAALSMVLLNIKC